MDANENRLVTVLRCQGDAPVDVTLRQQTGDQSGNVVADVANHVNIGREQHDGGRWYFEGAIDDVKIEGEAWTAKEIADLRGEARYSRLAKAF